MRYVAKAALAVGAALCCVSAHAQDHSLFRDCDSLQPDRTIPGCTAVIAVPGIPDKLKALALLRRGMAHYALRDIDAAIADFEASRALNPADVTVHNELGLAYGAKGDPKRAIGAFDEGLKLAPTQADIYYNRGVSYMMLGDVERALLDFSEAVELGPPQATALIEGGKIERAALARVHSNYYKALAAVYSAKGDHDRAIATHDEAVKRFPDFAYAYVNRAQAYEAKGDLARANADLDRAINLDPTSSSEIGGRAFMRFRTGDFAGAAADFDKAWSVNPRDAGLPKDYVPIWLYLTLARSDSKAAAAALTKLLPQVDQTHWPFPVVKLLLGQSSPEVTLAAAKTPDETCEAQFYIGEWRELQGDKAAARAGYQIARDTCPKTFFEFRGAEAELRRLGPQ